MKTKIFNLNSLLYISLVLALFASLNHVAYAFSTVNGNDLLSGYISAIAVDLGLLALAYGINRRKAQKVSTRSLWIGVIFFSGISVYANWLSGISHTVSIPDYEAHWLVSLRPIILSAVLPLLVIYLSEVVSGNHERYQVEAHKEAQKLIKQAHKVVSNEQMTPVTNDTVSQNSEPLTLANDTRQAQIEQRREQVLNLLSDGKSQNEIADELQVSLATIKRDTKMLNGKVKS